MKLRLTHKGSRKYYATGFDINLPDRKLMQQNKVRGTLKQKALSLLEIRINAENCCNGITNFSFTKFETVFFPKTVSAVNVKSVFEKYIRELSENGRVGTANCYHSACVSLHKFKPNLKFEHLTVEFLKSSEKWYGVICIESKRFL